MHLCGDNKTNSSTIKHNTAKNQQMDKTCDNDNNVLYSSVCNKYQTGHLEITRSFILNSQALQVIVVQPCLPARYVAKNNTKGNSGKSWRDNAKEWIGQSLSSLLCITDNRSQ